MKNLIEYINYIDITNNDVLYTDIYDDLISSSSCSLLNMISLSQFIFERHGKYDVCDELCKFILEEMKRHNEDNHEEDYVLHFSKSNLPDIQNVFFKEMFISVHIMKDNKTSAKYEVWQENIENYDAYKYDEKERLFNFVSIDVNIDEYGTLSSDIISHELNHAFEDYNRYVNNSSKLYQYIKDYGYVDIVNNIRYKRMNKYEKFVHVLLYVLSEHEQNAFISQLVNIIKNKASSLHSIKELYEYVYKNNSLFSSLNKIYNNFKYYINHEDEWEIVCRYYNQINDTNYPQHKIYSILSNLIYNFRNKLVSHIKSTYKNNNYIY